MQDSMEREAEASQDYSIDRYYCINEDITLQTNTKDE